MNEAFTRVEIEFYPEYVNNWLRFGEPDALIDLDRRRSLALFKPGRLFGYVRWWANEYGTQGWQFIVVKTVKPGSPLNRIEGVHPGGDVLLQAAGNTKVKQVLTQVDALEADDFNPAEVSPAYYRHIHNRIATRQRIRAYSRAQHQARSAASRIS